MHLFHVHVYFICEYVTFSTGCILGQSDIQKGDTFLLICAWVGVIQLLGVLASQHVYGQE